MLFSFAGRIQRFTLRLRLRQLPQMLCSVDRHSADQRRFSSIACRYKHSRKASAPGGFDHGQHSGNRPQTAIQRQLADEQQIFRIGHNQLAACGQDAERNSQIKSGPLFAEVSRSQIDCDALLRVTVAAIFDGGAHSFYGFSNG
ncbi:hypothetical protein D3C73_861310 [compost metagenome]